MKKEKGLLQLTAIELMSITSSKKPALIQAAAVKAIKSSVHGDTSQANLLVKMLPEITKRAGSKKTLIDYLVKWGNLRFSEEAGKFKVAKTLGPEDWTDSYETTVTKHRWDDAIADSPAPKPPFVDAEKEIRKVIQRLERVSESTDQELIHPSLILKIRAILFEYEMSGQHDMEVKRERTLFDKSVARTTVRASKYAKGM
jgi:hypothetical protein